MANLILQAQQQQQATALVPTVKKRKTFIVRKTKALVELASDMGSRANNAAAAAVAAAPTSTAASAPSSSVLAMPIVTQVQGNLLPAPAVAATEAAAMAAPRALGQAQAVGTSSSSDDDEEEEKPKKKVSIVSRSKKTVPITVAETKKRVPIVGKKMTLNDWMLEAKLSQQQTQLLETALTNLKTDKEKIIVELKTDKEHLQRQLLEAQRMLQEERQKQDKERRTHMQVLWDQNAASHRHVMNTNHELATSQQATIDKMSSSLVTVQRESIKTIYQNMKAMVPVWDSQQMVQHLNQTYQTPANAKPRLEYLNQVCDEWKSKTRDIPSTLLLEAIGDQQATQVIQLLDAERSTIEKAIAYTNTTAAAAAAAPTVNAAAK